MRYYIRQQREHISGPHEVEAIRTWIKEGKVRDSMEFSEDGVDWMMGPEMGELFNARARSRTRPYSRRQLS